MTLRRVTIGFLSLYTLLNVFSVARTALGLPPMAFTTPVTTLAGFIFALLHAGQREGWSRALRLLALVFIVSLLFESVGVATGLIYGPYHYTHKLGPLFLGLVPYLIPVAWFMMMYPSFVIGDRLIPAGWKRGPRVLAVAALGGMAMTAWDLVMEPIMVSTGHWIWDTNGPYFGIPLQNFWGWWLTVFVTLGLYMLVSGKVRRPADPGFDRLALASYLVTALGIAAIAMLIEIGNLGLIGLFAMLPWVVTGWLRTIEG